MKKIISILLMITLVFSLAACGKKTEPKNISVACIKGPTGVGMVQLMDNAEKGNGENNYNFKVVSSADEISGKIISGEINIASVPTNLAAKLYNKTQGKIVMLAVNTLGVLSIMENGNTIKSVADLKGKTIYSTGKGSNPEYILRHILKENGLDPDRDVKLQFLAANDELVASLVSGKAQVALVPEPAASTVNAKKSTVNKVLDVNEEWEKISDSKLMMGCIVALKSYVEANPDAVKSFLKEYKTSVEFAENNIQNTAELCEKYGIIPSRQVAEKAIPDCNLTFATGKEMQNSIRGYFEVLLNADKMSIGGNMPKEDFWYNEK